MILFHNLEFFDKKGNNLNLEKIVNVKVTLEDKERDHIIEIDNNVTYTDAVLEVITNTENQIEGIAIIKGGSGYTDKLTLIIEDTITGTIFDFSGSNFIICNEIGSITEIIIPIKQTGFTYPAISYKGDLYFQKISAGLIETEHIYVAEVTKTISDEELLIYPRVSKFENNNYISEISVNTSAEDSEIFLYDIDNTKSTPLINKNNISKYQLIEGFDDIIDNSYTRIIQKQNNQVLQINLGAQSENEGIYENVLKLQVHDTVIKDNIQHAFTYTFAEINVRAEIIGEDERLRYALENFGFSLSQEEAVIIRDADIQEHLPNFELLNEKRKELLLEYNNIFPYIGSYKALVNILKLLDYNDLRIKEYWLNVEMTKRDELRKPIIKNDVLKSRSANLIQPSVEEISSTKKINTLIDSSVETIASQSDTIKEKPVIIDSMIDFFDKHNYIPNSYKTKSLSFNERFYKQVDIPFELKGKGRNWKDEDFLPSEIWKKTSLFSLHYDFIRETGDYDEYGIPITEDVFMFSVEEVLIKLFALKKFLKEKFLPLNARIIDITGEGVYFTRYALNTWKDDTDTLYIDKEFQPSFVVNSSGYIEDLQDYGHKVSEIIKTNSIRNYYNNALFNFSETTNIAHNDNGPIGCIINLDCDIFDINWNELNLNWDELLIYYNVKFELTKLAVFGKLRFDDWFTGEISEFIFENLLDVNAVLENNELTEVLITQFLDTHSGNEYEDLSDYDILNILNWEIAMFELTTSDNTIVSSFNYQFDNIIPTKIIAYSNQLHPRTCIVQFINGLAGIFTGSPGQGINSWETVGQHEFYEIEWIITHETPGKFSTSKRESIILGKNTTLSVPFTGKYRIDLILYDLSNHTVRTHQYIDVKMPEIEINMLSRFTEHIENWDNFEEQNINWDNAGQEWRSPGLINNVSWDNCYNIWNDFEIQYHTHKDPIEQMIVNDTIQIERIHETDRFVGELIEINKQFNYIICSGTYVKPKLRNAINNIPQDYVYLRYDDHIHKTGVLTAEYINNETRIQLESIPDGLSEQWEVLREIGSLIIINDDIRYNEISNVSGIKENSWLRFEKKNEDEYTKKRIHINSVIAEPNDETNITGIVLDEPINKVLNEYGKIYSLQNAILVNLDEFVYNSDDTNKYFGINDNKEIVLLYNLLNNEIIPGFSILKLKSVNEIGTIYEQRVLVEHLSQDTEDKSILKVIELDGDLSLVTENTSLEYEYWQFNAKLIHFEDLYGKNSNTVELNFNDYPYKSDFVETIVHEDVITITEDITKLWYINDLSRPPEFKAYNANIDGNICFDIFFDETININDLKVPKINDMIVLSDSDNLYVSTFVKEIQINMEDNYFTIITYDQSLLSSLNINPDYYFKLDYTVTTEIINKEIEYKFNDNWYFDYIIRDGHYSIQINDIGYVNNKTILSLNDNESELYRISPRFNVSWSNFDEDFAEQRIGINSHSWDIYNKVNWNDLKSLQWKHTEFYQGISCGFEILQICPNGTIQFNEYPKFVTLDWNTAVDELNNTSNKGLSRFNFKLDNISNPSKIIATAKNQIISSLGYIIFENGCKGIQVDPTISHTYPLGYYEKWNDPYEFGIINKYANWNPVARTYYEYGFNPLNNRGWYPAIQYKNDKTYIVTTPKIDFLYPDYESSNSEFSLPMGYPNLLKTINWRYPEALQSLYDHIIAGSFTWNDFYTSIHSSKFYVMTTVFFNLSNCKIYGKHKYKWVLIHRNNNEILCECKEPEFIWTFSEKGMYDLQVFIEDINGNTQSIIKNAFIEIV